MRVLFITSKINNSIKVLKINLRHNNNNKCCNINYKKKKTKSIYTSSNYKCSK